MSSALKKTGRYSKKKKGEEPLVITTRDKVMGGAIAICMLGMICLFLFSGLKHLGG